MCGIAGIAAPDGFDPKLLISMTDLIDYRGPDGFGFAFFSQDKAAPGEVFHNERYLPGFKNPMIGLGSRRLAILDLSALGNQPMQTEDGTLFITFNGEIYNYVEIRKALEELGHSFKTHTDTEVILRSYKEWGVDCLKRFNGMWAFALWDKSRQRLFCARDRFGEKPFYYHVGPKHFIFGSEIKQLLVSPEIRREANDQAVFAYLEYALRDFTNETFFKGIFQLPAASYLTLDLSQSSVVPEIRTYWDLQLRETKGDEDELRDEFLDKFTRAVNIRMRSDVPVGSCLSGGLDSSSIVCVARKISPAGDFHTFSSCSEDKAFDERDFVAEVVRSTGVRSHLIFPKPEEFWANFKRLLWHQDEPFGDASVFAQWCVMRKAREERIPVLLDGQGGDETLCGYLKFYYFYLWHLLKSADPKFLSEAFFRLMNGTDLPSLWKRAGRYLPHFVNAPSSLAQRLCQPHLLQECRNGFSKLLGPGQSLAERQKLDATRLSVPTLLHYEDRNSMAHSIESRVPFLDHELAEFLVNCPDNLKLRHGWTKCILRQSLRGILPERVRLRKDKMWFSAPQKKWIKEGMQAGIRQHLASAQLRMERFLVPQKVEDEITRFFDGSACALSDAPLFRVINLELWADVFDVS
ncbi:MAG: asparagine synthase (glutamine-hydrolyzing) [Acidobacteria bacterium]|nr:MAG: asparagine synthase (glutamine-hydrolyzing) [Acidobacteriota bacterium]